MSQATSQSTEDPAADPLARPPGSPTVGGVPFVLVLLAAFLVLIPWTRAFGILCLVLLAVPALVVWHRARGRSAGGRGLTSATVLLGAGALLIGVVAASHGDGPAAVSPPVQDAATEHPAPLPPAAIPPAAIPPPVPDAAVVQPRPPAPAVAPPPAPALVPAPVAVDPPTRHATPLATRRVPAAVQKPRATPAPTRQLAGTGSSGGSAYYKNCAAARSAGVASLHTSDPGYRAGLDRDGDGIACE